MKKFSVLMSIYKNEQPEFLKMALNSILDQTLIPSEIVIVEDGPLTKSLYEVLDEYSKKFQIIKRVPFEKNRGLGLALRDGILACSNEWIARMDTDDISMPNRFECQFNYLSLHSDVALLGTWIKEFSKDSKHPETKTKLPCSHDDICSFAKKRNPFRHVTVVYKKSAVLDSGNYRDFLWFEDYDLFLRMIMKGYQVANIPEYLVMVRADSDMFARRGGAKYIEIEHRFFKFMLDSHFLSKKEYIFNISLRTVVRMVPNGVRKFLYKTFLRS